MPKSAVRWYLAANLPLVVLIFAFPEYHLVLWGLLGTSAAAAVVVGAVTNRPQGRYPWVLLAAGLATFVTGDVVYDLLTRVAHQNNPFPSVADVFYLATYPLAGLGLLCMVCARRREKDLGALLDALIVTTACALLAWVYLIGPSIRVHDMTLLQKIVSVEYPLGDIAILCVLVRLLLTGALGNRSLGLLTLGGLGLLSADVAYGMIQLNGNWKVGGPTDVGWVLFYLCWGAAALHPSMGQLTEAQLRPRREVSMATLVVLGATTLIAPGLLVWQVATSGRPRDAGMIGVVSGLLFVLVMGRMTGLARAQVAQARRERALRRVGERLVAASELAEVDAAAIEGVRAMVGSTVSVCVVTVPDGDRDLVVAGEPRDLVNRQIHVEETAGGILKVSGLGTGGGTEWASIELGGSEGSERRVLFAYRGRLPVASAVVVDALRAQLTLAVDRVRLAKELHQRQGEARFRSLIRNASDVILLAQANGELRFETPSVEVVLGYRLNAIRGLPIRILIHPDDVDGAAAILEAVWSRSRSGPITAAWRVRHFDGRWLDMEVIANNFSDDPALAGVVLTLRDVSDRNLLEAELRHRAFHDGLTNLANRVLFIDRVDHALARSGRTGAEVSVLLMDVDDFKIVNDTLGHAVGDALLVQLADRLVGCLRQSDTVARLGGDEFAVCVEIMQGAPTDVAATAQKILQVMRAPFTVAGVEIAARVSIGVTTAGAATEGADDMLRHADLALYAAKNAGKGTCRFFDDSLNRMVLDRIERRAELEQAIEGGQLLLHYQPVIGLADGEIVGVEALVRWQHPGQGLVPPLDFIPLAEESGLVVPLGQWVLNRACADLGRWQKPWTASGRPPLRVAINVSPRQLQSSEFLVMVDETLARHQVDPAWLIFEITEGVLIQDSEDVMRRLRDIESRGISLALDDFGTGYSSLSYLHRFPIEILKIDQSFVRGMDEREDRKRIIEAIVSLAAGLGLELVAEGIESESQASRLRELGCRLGQGYHLGRPAPAATIGELLDRERALTPSR